MKRLRSLVGRVSFFQTFIYLLLVLLAFVSFFDVSVLNPTNIGWISEGDLRQHYLGWVAFRQAETLGSPWASAPLLAYPFGVPISATDSNPLFSLLLWPIEAYLPEDFQFIGIWYLLSISLSLGVATALMRKGGFDRLSALLLGAVLAFQPILFWRYGHDTLMAQWLILSAIYVSFGVRRTLHAIACYAALLSLAIFIHPYLFVLVNFVVGFDLGIRFLRHRGLRFGIVEKATLAFVTAQAAALYFGNKLGVFSLKTKFSNEVGVHSTDLISFVNPFDSSRILPQLSASEGQYEGYAYLGIGIILLGSVLIVLSIRRGMNPSFLRGLLPVQIAALAAFLFALGPTISFLGEPLFSVDLDEGSPIRIVFEKLRSSGRFVWLTVYVLVFSMLLCLPRNKPLLVNSVAVAILVLQYLDLAPLRERTHADTAWREVPTHELATNEWAKRIDRAEFMYMSRQLGLEFSLHAGAVAFPRNTPLSWFYTAQGLGLPKQLAAEEQLTIRVLNGGHQEDAIYLLDPTFDLPLVHRNYNDILATRSHGEFHAVETEAYLNASPLSKMTHGLTELLESCVTDCTAVVSVKAAGFSELSAQTKAFLGARGSRIAAAQNGDGYVAVLRNGSLVEETIKPGADATLNTTINNRVFSALSSVESPSNVAAISVDGADFSRNRSGVNVVMVADDGRIVTANFDTSVESDSLYSDDLFQNDLLQMSYSSPERDRANPVVFAQPTSGDQPFVNRDRYLSEESSLLDVISRCRQDCTMAISVKDEGAASLPKRVRESAAQIGLTMAKLDYRDGYSAIIENGVVLVQGKSSDEIVDVAEIIEGRRVRVRSGGFKAGSVSSISIDGEELSMSRRGFNIVVLIEGQRTISYHFDTHGGV